jgi:hypothetical protein
MFPGVYDAECVAYRTGETRALIPQVYGSNPAILAGVVGTEPAPGERGWVMFRGGDAAYPVWIGSGTVSEGLLG